MVTPVRDCGRARGRRGRRAATAVIMSRSPRERSLSLPPPPAAGADDLVPMTDPPLRAPARSETPHAATPLWQRIPAVPLVLAVGLLAFTLLPRVADNPRLLWTFRGAVGLLLAWTALLWATARRRGFPIEFVTPLKSHYIQASVQLCIYAYWGWSWRDVYAEAPLIAAQLVFLYAFDALLTWSRGRPWRPGFGPLPIVLSTNVFIWFRDDWYGYQFLMVAVGALGKEFIKWTREGRRTHVFNPSAFTLAAFSLALILTGTTDLTWGRSIATTFTAPLHIYLVIFLLGLIVQYFFAVTLLTLSAVAVLCGLNLLWFKVSGTYWFVDSNLPVPIFIGLHFLMTDPSTSPRTNAGRVIFGALYGLFSFALFGLFQQLGVPTIYDKLLPIPVLNLSVKLIDRLARSGWPGRFARWETTLLPRRANLLYMGCWAGLFLTMLMTGYVEAPHEGHSVLFWKRAAEENRYNARNSLLGLLKGQVERDDGDAWNVLGLLYSEGRLMKVDDDNALHCFARASELGSLKGSANLVRLHFAGRGRGSDLDRDRAIDQLEKACGHGGEPAAFQLVGLAYESGHGRPQDTGIARLLYGQGCALGDQAACASASRLRATPPATAPAVNRAGAADAADAAGAARTADGDAEAAAPAVGDSGPR